MADKLLAIKNTLKVGDTYETAEELVKVRQSPNMGTAREALDWTTQADDVRKYAPGMRDNGGTMEFTAFYTLEDYEKLLNVADDSTFWYELGENGENGIFTWTGSLDVVLDGAAAGDQLTMTITIIPSSEITLYSAL